MRRVEQRQLLHGGQLASDEVVEQRLVGGEGVVHLLPAPASSGCGPPSPSRSLNLAMKVIACPSSGASWLGSPSGAVSANAGTELEFIVFIDTYEEAWKQGLPRPRAGQSLQHRLLAAGDRAGRAADPAHPQRDGRRRHDGGELEGRVQLRPARDQLPLRRRAAHRRQPRDLQERRQGDRRPGGHAITFMAKFNEREGNSCHIHCSLRGEDGATSSPPTRQLFERFVAGQLACMRELTLLYAPHVNSYKRFAPGLVRADRGRLGERQPHLLAAGGRPRRRALRVENRLPGADVNPYLALAAMIAAGLHGIDTSCRWSRPSRATPTSPTSRGCRTTSTPRATCSPPARWPREAFGAGGGRPLPEPGAGRDRRLRGGGHRLGALPGLRAALMARPARSIGSAPRSSGCRWGVWDGYEVTLAPRSYVARGAARRRRRARAAARRGGGRASPTCCSTGSTALILAGGADIDPAQLRRRAAPGDEGHLARARPLRAGAGAAGARARHAGAGDLPRHAAAQRRAGRHARPAPARVARQRGAPHGRRAPSATTDVRLEPGSLACAGGRAPSGSVVRSHHHQGVERAGRGPDGRAAGRSTTT